MSALLLKAEVCGD